jgi:3-dehydroquinate dehydratase type I
MSSLCVSLSAPTLEECTAVLRARGQAGVGGVAEIRVDLISVHGKGAVTDDQLAQVFTEAATQGLTTVATCRDVKPEPGFTEARSDLLLRCMELGATYIDIEVESPSDYKRKLVEAARARTPAPCKVIVSYHNYECTPSTEELDSVVAECFAGGAEIAKVAVQATCVEDSARVLALYAKHKSGTVLALGMGAHGGITRVAAPLLGAPFTFVSHDAASATAPGQLTADEMISVFAIVGGATDAQATATAPGSDAPART